MLQAQSRFLTSLLNTLLTNRQRSGDTIMRTMATESLTIQDVAASRPGERVLQLSGPLVLTSFFEFQDIVRADKSAKLVLDFSGVPYIDSAGIGALVGAYVNRQKDARELLLVGVNSRVRTALKVTKVEQFFTFADSAVAAS
jgi:anti-sigma B factor antagonist